MWRLEVVDWAGPTRWRWRLSGAEGAVVEHVVELDPRDWRFEAFTDLYRYLQWTVTPDRRREREPGVLAEVGDWIGDAVLGPVGAAIGTRRATVQLELPAEAAVLGYRPWELARVADRGGRRSWAASRVRVVVVPQPHRPLAKTPVGSRLRMLAVFSLPDGENALNLRRERFELARLVQKIARVHGKAVELRVVQYGATRQRLTDALLEEPGWDVVHLSGHGLAGGLMLEDDAGRPDEISSDELVELLDLGSEQIKLVTLSSCESAAVTALEHLRLLGLGPERDAAGSRGDPADPAVERRPDGADGRAGSGGPGDVGPADVGGRPAPLEGLRTDDGTVDVSAAPAGDGDQHEGEAVGADPPEGVGERLPAVAAAVVERLDCAVLAMRYPVADEFAIELAGSFYGLLFGSGQPVAGAVASSLAVPGRPGRPAVSGLALGTPALFGGRAADLTLVSPDGELQRVEARGKLAEFDDQPERFVGRVAALTRVSKALAPGPGRPGVVLHGMAGAGKTACALELAYTHQATFPLMAWFKAPEERTEIRPALASFALALERQLPGLQWRTWSTTRRSCGSSCRGSGRCSRTTGSCWCSTTSSRCSPRPGSGATSGGGGCSPRCSGTPGCRGLW